MPVLRLGRAVVPRSIVVTSAARDLRAVEFPGLVGLSAPSRPRAVTVLGGVALISAMGNSRRRAALVIVCIGALLAGVAWAVIEPKDNRHTLGDGMQQALGYAEALDTPFAFSRNGDGFLMHDRTGQRTPIEQAFALDDFPGPEELWQRHCCWKGIITSRERRAAVETLHYDDGSGKVRPRYHQVIAINRTIKSAKGQRGC